MELISIIIPVFNAETTIGKCLDSCIKQTYKNLEIIIINDGSTDKSQNLIENYILYDSRIKLFNKENEGLVSARKTAIQYVKGKYVSFVDADDYIEYNTIELLTNYSEDVDIIIGDFIIEDIQGQKSNTQHSNCLRYGNRNEGMYCNFLSKQVVPSLCGRLIKTEYLKAIAVPIDITVGEDFITNMLILDTFEVKVALLNKPIYHYVQYPISMVNNNTKALAARIKYIKWVVNYFSNKNSILYPSIKIYLCLYWKNVFLICGMVGM